MLTKPDLLRDCKTSRNLREPSFEAQQFLLIRSRVCCYPSRAVSLVCEIVWISSPPAHDGSVEAANKLAGELCNCSKWPPYVFISIFSPVNIAHDCYLPAHKGVKVNWCIKLQMDWWKLKTLKDYRILFYNLASFACSVSKHFYHFFVLWWSE